ncbi:MAG: M20/M25/M40 family metallo-hydrolase [Pyrinomonadaceae bacterium]|nr:M20/M25/M40 family metallo-hydrolase [Pyrinomonadaceae bacterium]
MKTRKTIKILTAIMLMQTVLLPGLVFAQPEANIYERIRKEGTENSQVMKTIQVLTDVYGPRLTGSPNLKAAGEWAAQQMTSWGMENAALEPWDWGFPGWVSERASGFIVSPVQDSLVFEVLAWTPSTNGVVKAEAFNMVLPDRPTQEELTAYFDSIRANVKGKIVLFGNPARVPVNLDPPAKRMSDEVAKQRVNPYARATPQQPQQFTPPTPKPNALPFPQVIDQVNKFLMESGVPVRVNDAGREHGQIRAFSFSRGDYDPAKTIPTVVMRNEDYGRIARLLGSGKKVELEFDIRNKIYPEGKTAYNTVAEIVGTDKKDEVVMLGGHLDSWHSATGATDNATGCAVMMEAARILKALGVKPRRTIRVALWSGEEQGLLGSQAYVKKHFGTAESPTPAWFKFNGYINHDTGTGRIRGLNVFGPQETAQVLREIVGPYSYMGIEGAIATASRGLGGTDHTSFNAAGLPGIGTMLDPIEYGTHTWHTNLDTYERLIEDDLQQSAIIAAAVVYHLAMSDQMLPRFAKDKLPAAPAPRN